MKKLSLVINNTKKKDKELFFNKRELKSIFNLYAEMVSRGFWKDYGLSISPKKVSFEIYKRSSEKPFLKISKNLYSKIKDEKYFLIGQNDEVIGRGRDLDQLLRKSEKFKLKIVV